MYDLVIIGSGPAGLSAAIYAKRANLNVVVLEKEYMGTGQIAESERVDNYPGLYGISGFDLGEKLREHAEKLGAEILNDAVREINVEEGQGGFDRKFITSCENGQVYESLAVVYAAGASPKKSQMKGAERFEGKGISYCALCDGAFFQKKKVAVLGGGDTALDDASYLSEICEQVYLIHRRKEFRGSASTVHKLEQKENVTFVLEDEVVSVSGEGKVEELSLKSGKNIPVDGIFVAFGSDPNSTLLQGLVKLDEGGYAIAPESGETSCEGLFVAGDVRTKELRQVVTAISDGANVISSCCKYIRNR